MEILATGRATCVVEPLGECGLEGYERGKVYAFERIKTKLDQVYVRVYPDTNDRSYHETCGPKSFRRFFEVLAETVPEH